MAPPLPPQSQRKRQQSQQQQPQQQQNMPFSAPGYNPGQGFNWNPSQFQGMGGFPQWPSNAFYFGGMPQGASANDQSAKIAELEAQLKEANKRSEMARKRAAHELEAYKVTAERNAKELEAGYRARLLDTQASVNLPATTMGSHTVGRSRDVAQAASQVLSSQNSPPNSHLRISSRGRGRGGSGRSQPNRTGAPSATQEQLGTNCASSDFRVDEEDNNLTVDHPTVSHGAKRRRMNMSELVYQRESETFLSESARARHEDRHRTFTTDPAALERFLKARKSSSERDCSGF